MGSAMLVCGPDTAVGCVTLPFILVCSRCMSTCCGCFSRALKQNEDLSCQYGNPVPKVTVKCTTMSIQNGEMWFRLLSQKNGSMNETQTK